MRALSQEAVCAARIKRNLSELSTAANISMPRQADSGFLEA